MTHDTIQRLARERAIQRLSPSQANIVQDMRVGYVLAELTLDEARTFRPGGAEGLARVRGRETAKETAR
jgi:hypothetical protein